MSLYFILFLPIFNLQFKKAKKGHLCFLFEGIGEKFLKKHKLSGGLVVKPCLLVNTAYLKEVNR